MSFAVHLRDLYARFERPISSFSLIAGFAFDALTLKRVDTLWENIWVVAHLMIVAVFIILIHATEKTTGDEQNPSKAHFWYVNILQFFFGGILSTYVVFYFRSADIFVTWPFIIILIGAFWANESLKRHYIRLSFQMSLLFLSLYSFAIFIVPVIGHEIGPRMFLLSGFLSVLCMSVFMYIISRFAPEEFKQSKPLLIALIVFITVAINTLYFLRLIPPIPLSLKDAGMYHSIIRDSDGAYTVQYENRGLRGYFELYPKFSKQEGEPVYAFSSIFSPSHLNLTIIHEWQWYDGAQKEWVTKSVVHLSIIGGRDDGFRTFSVVDNLSPGKWRVNVETADGQIIGRLRFTLVPSATEPLLTTDTK